MKETYIITEKKVYCDYRCPGTLSECINCKKSFEVIEQEKEVDKKQLYDILNSGQCYITKVTTK